MGRWAGLGSCSLPVCLASKGGARMEPLCCGTAAAAGQPPGTPGTPCTCCSCLVGPARSDRPASMRTGSSAEEGSRETGQAASATDRAMSGCLQPVLAAAAGPPGSAPAPARQPVHLLKHLAFSGGAPAGSYAYHQIGACDQLLGICQTHCHAGGCHSERMPHPCSASAAGSILQGCSMQSVRY